jgi:hypothetical protein
MHIVDNMLDFEQVNSVKVNPVKILNRVVSGKLVFTKNSWKGEKHGFRNYPNQSYYIYTEPLHGYGTEQC